MRAQAIDSVDTWLLETIDRHRNHGLTSFARFVMDAGTSPRSLAVFAVLGAALVIAFRFWRPGFAFGVAFLLSGMAADALKQVIGRARPPLELAAAQVHGLSMPSSVAAATSAATIAALIAFPWNSPRTHRGFTLALVVVLAVVGACMVYLGAHWASDVLAGWLLGSAVGTAVGLVCRDRTRVALRSGVPSA